MANGCIYYETGLMTSPQLENPFFNAEHYDVGLRQTISVGSYFCQCGTCFMEDRYSLTRFVLFHGGLIWFY